MKGPVGLLVVALLLSGCGGKGNDHPIATNPTATGPSQSVTLAVTMDRPEWQRGQVWTYRVEIPGLAASTFRMTVAEDQGGLWIVATDDRAKALSHALYSTNPVLGRITKEALSPYQSGRPVEMYSFPLEDRRAWSSPFFGEPMQFSATYSDTIEALPKTYLPGFTVVAKGAGQARVLFNYVEAIEWFSDFQVYNAAGEKEIHLILTNYGAEYAGPYYFLRGHDQFARAFTASTNVTPATTFDVAEDFSTHAVGLIVHNTGQQVGLVNVTLKAPAGTVALARQYTLAKAQQELEAVEVPASKGVWTVEVSIVGSIRIDLRVVGTNVFQGTL